MHSEKGSGRSPGEGNGNPLQYSCLKNPMDTGAWWATAHRVTESDITEQLNHHDISVNNDVTVSKRLQPSNVSW